MANGEWRRRTAAANGGSARRDALRCRAERARLSGSGDRRHHVDLVASRRSLEAGRARSRPDGQGFFTIARDS
jgi:hypothetical protein